MCRQIMLRYYSVNSQHWSSFVVLSLTKLSRVLIRASNSCSPRRLLCRGPKVEPARPTVPMGLGLWTERSSRIRLCSPPALHNAETFTTKTMEVSSQSPLFSTISVKWWKCCMCTHPHTCCGSTFQKQSASSACVLPGSGKQPGCGRWCRKPPPLTPPGPQCHDFSAPGPKHPHIENSFFSPKISFSHSEKRSHKELQQLQKWIRVRLHHLHPSFSHQAEMTHVGGRRWKCEHITRAKISKAFTLVPCWPCMLAPGSSAALLAPLSPPWLHCSRSTPHHQPAKPHGREAGARTSSLRPGEREMLPLM